MSEQRASGQQRAMSNVADFNRKPLLWVANACMFVFGVVLLLMGSLLPRLEVSYAQAGSLGSFPLAGILVATLLVGPVLDLLGAKPVLAGALAVIAACLGFLSHLHSYRELAFIALVYGFGGGLLNTAANALVADLSAAGRATALNLLGFFFSLGAVTAPLAMSVAQERISPAFVLNCLAVLCAAVFVAMLVLRFPPASQPGVRLSQLLRVLREPIVWLFAVLLFFESGTENSMFVWTGRIVQDVLHTTSSRAEFALVALSVALGAGRLVAALWLRKVGNYAGIWISTSITVIGCGTLFSTRSFAGMMAGASIVGLGLSTIFPTVLAIAGDQFEGNTGTVFGGIIAVALVGGTAGPKLAGALAAAGPLRMLWIPMASAILIAALTGGMWRSREYNRQKKNQ